MQIFVAYPTNSEFQPWESIYVPRFLDDLRGNPGEYAVASSFDEADMILLYESNMHKPRDQDERLSREPVLRRACEKVCTLNYEDSPGGYLRGLYSSLEDDKYDPAIHRSWPAINLPNDDVYDVDDETIRAASPERLFSFAGSASHPLRRRLLDRFSRPAEHYRVTEIKRWFDHTAAEHHGYIKDILASQFVLCPRGHASYTHRIAEVMALGRVPVVLADHWVPFSIAESDYYLRIPERQLGELEGLLAAKQADAAAMGAHARNVWWKYFSRQNRARAVLDAIRALMETPGAAVSLENYRRRWSSGRFKRMNKLTFAQRAWRRVKRSLRQR